MKLGSPPLLAVCLVAARPRRCARLIPAPVPERREPSGADAARAGMRPGSVYRAPTAP